jgi:hypothetical protein
LQSGEETSGRIGKKRLTKFKNWTTDVKPLRVLLQLETTRVQLMSAHFVVLAAKEHLINELASSVDSGGSEDTVSNSQLETLHQRERY